MADPQERPDPAPWSDVDQAFFASAPPDVPEPPPEPMRFDDLEVAVVQVRRRHALASARRRKVRLTASAWYRAWYRAWHGLAGGLAAARGATARTTRLVVDRFIALLAEQLLSWRGRAIVGATIIISIAFPAMLVASRPVGHASESIMLPRPPAIGGESAMIAHASPPVPLPFPPDPDPDPPAQASAESRPHHAAATRRPTHKHRHKHHARARKDLSAF